jgi:hypothetical protein
MDWWCGLGDGVNRGIYRHWRSYTSVNLGHGPPLLPAAGMSVSVAVTGAAVPDSHPTADIPALASLWLLGCRLLRSPNCNS